MKGLIATIVAIVLALSCGVFMGMGSVMFLSNWIIWNELFVILGWLSISVAFVIILALLAPHIESLLWKDRDNP